MFGRMTTSTVTTLFGPALKRWRTSRRLSQLDLATRAQTPSRHVSFLETCVLYTSDAADE